MMIAYSNNTLQVNEEDLKQSVAQFLSVFCHVSYECFIQNEKLQKPLCTLEIGEGVSWESYKIFRLSKTEFIVK